MARHGWRQVEINFKGRIIEADYCVFARGKGVTVATLRSCRSRECTNDTAEDAAKRLLHELAADGMA